MSIPLQIAIGLAALAFVALVATLVPAILQVRRQADQIAATVAELRGDVAGLVRDSRDTLARLGELSTRVEREWHHVEKVVDTVRDWTERADRVITQVDAAIEPPLMSTVRAVGLARVGIGAFMDVFRHRRRGAASTPESQGGD
jgi:uncharacterized protein YoxC